MVLVLGDLGLVETVEGSSEGGFAATSAHLEADVSSMRCSGAGGVGNEGNEGSEVGGGNDGGKE